MSLYGKSLIQKILQIDVILQIVEVTWTITIPQPESTAHTDTYTTIYIFTVSSPYDISSAFAAWIRKFL